MTDSCLTSCCVFKVAPTQDCECSLKRSNVGSERAAWGHAAGWPLSCATLSLLVPSLCGLADRLPNEFGRVKGRGEPAERGHQDRVCSKCRAAFARIPIAMRCTHQSQTDWSASMQVRIHRQVEQSFSCVLER